MSGRFDKEGELRAAFGWVREKYNIQEWERDPWGGYHPIGTLLVAIEADVPAGD